MRMSSLAATIAWSLAIAVASLAPASSVEGNGARLPNEACMNVNFGAGRKVRRTPRAPAMATLRSARALRLGDDMTVSLRAGGAVRSLVTLVPPPRVVILAGGGHWPR